MSQVAAIPPVGQAHIAAQPSSAHSIPSPGLKSDILHGKTGFKSRNLPLHRISCSLRSFVLGIFHPCSELAHCLLYNIIPKKSSVFLNFFENFS